MDRAEQGPGTSPSPRTGVVSALAVASFVTGALYLLAGVSILRERNVSRSTGYNFEGFFTLVGGSFTIVAVPLVVAGVGVWQRRAWGRILSLVLALALALFGIGLMSLEASFLPYALPLFAFAAFSLVVLLQRRFAAEFS